LNKKVVFLNCYTILTTPTRRAA